MAAKLKQAILVTRTDFDDNLNQKFNSNKTKRLLVENELKKAGNIWFELFYCQKSFKIKWYTKLFSISANEHIFQATQWC